MDSGELKTKSKLRDKRFYFSKIHYEYIFLDKFLAKKSIGIDGVKAAVFYEDIKAESSRVSKKIKTGAYKFSPLAEILVSKGRNKAPRILGLPTIRDQVTLSCLKDYLHANFEKCINRDLPDSYVYKMNKKIDEILKTGIQHSFIKVDITGFYDNLDREKLMSMVRAKIKDQATLKLLYDAIQNPVIPRSSHKKNRYKYFTPKGVPQGLAISNVLANIYMHKFDEIFKGESLTYMRYVDDIVVFCPRKQQREILNSLHFQISKLGLSLNDEKTETGIIGEDSFDFLGYQIRPQKKGTLNTSLISVRQSSVERLITSLANKLIGADYRRDKFLGLHEKLTEETYKKVLIEDLNEKITGAFSKKRRYGWLFYFSQINDISLLYQLDRIVESLCDRCQTFGNKKPKKIKSFVKAYREIHSLRIKGTGESEYIRSYDTYSLEEKVEFLELRGVIREKGKMTDSEIELKLNKFLSRRLSSLEMDIKGLS